MCAILRCRLCSFVFFFQAEDGIRDYKVTGVQTCALPILISAGGMLPVAYALLAEIMPTRHRGWSLVLVGGIGALGGFFAASSLSALLQPVFGWRDRKSTRLNSSHLVISYAVFCLKKKKFPGRPSSPERSRRRNRRVAR